MKKLIESSPKDLEKLRRLASYASISVAGFLVAMKLGAFVYTNALSLLSSLVDSGVDVLASFVTLFGIMHALQPPDREHRFGHGKAEALAALGQGAFILGSSAFLLFESLDRFITPMPVAHTMVGYVVMSVSIIATIGLLALQGYVVRQTDSLAVSADRMHYVGDTLINLAVMVSLGVQEWTGYFWIDPLFACLIGLYLVRTAWCIGKESLAVLMDKELPEEDRSRILALTLGTKGVLGAHDLRTRTDSARPIVEVHVEMDPTITLADAHVIVEAVERRIHSAYPKADILIHQDPSGVSELRLDVVIEQNDPE